MNELCFTMCCTTGLRYIQGQMCEELQSRVYSNAQASTSAPRVSSSGGAQRAYLRNGSASQLPRRASLQNGLAIGRSINGVRQSADGNKPAGPVVVSTQQLVMCLSQLDAVDDAKAYLSYTARHEVRRLILNAVQEAATAASQSYHAVVGSMDTSGGISLAVPQHVEYLAQQVVGRVAESCMEVRSSHLHVCLAQLIARKSVVQSCACGGGLCVLGWGGFRLASLACCAIMCGCIRYNTSGM